jgi:hypothetical protein
MPKNQYTQASAQTVEQSIDPTEFALLAVHIKAA